MEIYNSTSLPLSLSESLNNTKFTVIIGNSLANAHFYMSTCTALTFHCSIHSFHGSCWDSVSRLLLECSTFQPRDLSTEILLPETSSYQKEAFARYSNVH